MRNFLEDRLKKSLQEETKRLRNSESVIVSHRPKLDAEGRRLDAAASGLRGRAFRETEAGGGNPHEGDAFLFRGRSWGKP